VILCHIFLFDLSNINNARRKKGTPLAPDTHAGE
jgi:hypothetical protein